MPIYEYRCNDCRRKISLLIRSLSTPQELTCTSCGSKNLTRLFSTFARVKTDKDVYEDILSDNDLTKRMMANDPSAMLEWSRKMEGTQNEKTPEYQEMVERMEKGEPIGKFIHDFQQREFGSPETQSPPPEEE
jgi:putative FmdB family regulatory protein